MCSFAGYLLVVCGLKQISFAGILRRAVSLINVPARLVIFAQEKHLMFCPNLFPDQRHLHPQNCLNSSWMDIRW